MPYERCKYMSGSLVEKWGLYVDTAGFSKCILIKLS